MPSEQDTEYDQRSEITQEQYSEEPEYVGRPTRHSAYSAADSDQREFSHTEGEHTEIQSVASDINSFDQVAEEIVDNLQAFEPVDESDEHDLAERIPERNHDRLFSDSQTARSSRVYSGVPDSEQSEQFDEPETVEYSESDRHAAPPHPARSQRSGPGFSHNTFLTPEAHTFTGQTEKVIKQLQEEEGLTFADGSVQYEAVEETEFGGATQRTQSESDIEYEEIIHHEAETEYEEVVPEDTEYRESEFEPSEPVVAQASIPNHPAKPATEQEEDMRHTQPRSHAPSSINQPTTWSFRSERMSRNVADAMAVVWDKFWAEDVKDICGIIKARFSQLIPYVRKFFAHVMAFWGGITYIRRALAAFIRILKRDQRVRELAARIGWASATTFRVFLSICTMLVQASVQMYHLMRDKIIPDIRRIIPICYYKATMRLLHVAQYSPWVFLFGPFSFTFAIDSEKIPDRFLLHDKLSIPQDEVTFASGDMQSFVQSIRESVGGKSSSHGHDSAPEGYETESVAYTYATTQPGHPPETMYSGMKYEGVTASGHAHGHQHHQQNHMHHHKHHMAHVHQGHEKENHYQGQRMSGRGNDSEWQTIE